MGGTSWDVSAFKELSVLFLNLFPALAKQRINKYEFCKKHVEKTINETKGISKSDESQTAWQRELTPDVRCPLLNLCLVLKVWSLRDYFVAGGRNLKKLIFDFAWKTRLIVPVSVISNTAPVDSMKIGSKKKTMKIDGLMTVFANLAMALSVQHSKFLKNSITSKLW